MSEDASHNTPHFSGNNAESGFNSGIIRKTEYFDLFISYKRDNGDDLGQKMAERLYRDLTKQGFKVWLDNEQIGFSRDFEKRIEEAILHSKKFACVLSEAWLESENCRYEYFKALEFEKRIVPVHYSTFRDRLLEQKKEGTLTENQWRRLDKPQEINFSQEDYYENALQDLIAICRLKDDATSQHTKLLCESYYWERYGQPKGMLLRGIQLTKTKRLKATCQGDEELPSFVQLQNDFLEASEAFVSTEVSRKRNVFISFSKDGQTLATAIDLELRLQDISTWFDDFDQEQAEQSEFIEAILNSETIVHITQSLDQEENLKLAFARSNDKRILHITNVKEVFDQHRKAGDSTIFFWQDGEPLDTLITSIKGDAAYISAHALLLEQAYQWEKSGKSDGKLLALKEAQMKKEWYQIAETQRFDPKPNLKMIDFVERSIVRGEAMAKRKRMAFLTTLIGAILLVILGVGAYWANDARLSAQNSLDSAKDNLSQARKKVSAAELMQKDLEAAFQKSEREFEERRKQISESLKAAQDSLIKKESLFEEAEIALAQAVESSDSLEKVYTFMQEAYAQIKVERQEAESRLEEVEREWNRINQLVLARREAAEAAHFIRFDLEEPAQNLADSAVMRLTQNEETIQLQPLYEVYRDLVKDSSLSVGSKDENIDLKNLLLRMDASPKELHGALVRQDTSFLGTLKRRYLKQPKLYATHTLSTDSQFVAIGTRNGYIHLFDTKTDSLVDVFKYHSHRITSLLFAPNNHFLVTTAIDQRMTVIPLNSDFTRDTKLDVIEQDLPVRMTDLFFLGNDVVVGLHKYGAQAWGITVSKLLELVADEP